MKILFVVLASLVGYFSALLIEKYQNKIGGWWNAFFIWAGMIVLLGILLQRIIG